MITAPATLADVKYVLDNLCEVNRAEHAALDLNSWEALKKAKDFMKHGEATTGFIDGKPAVVFGVVWEESDWHRTWFVATEAYWNAGLAAVRHAREFLKKAARKGPLVTGSCSPHPHVDHWFRVLGFEKLEESNGVKWFKYA